MRFGICMRLGLVCWCVVLVCYCCFVGVSGWLVTGMSVGLVLCVHDDLIVMLLWWCVAVRFGEFCWIVRVLICSVYIDCWWICVC